MNSATARERGLAENELIEVSNDRGFKVKGNVHMTEGIHPRVIGMGGDHGHWSNGMPLAKGKGVTFQLTYFTGFRAH